MLANRKREMSLRTFYGRPQQKEQTYKQKKITHLLLPTIAEDKEMKRMKAKELSINISKFEGLTCDSSAKNSEEHLRSGLQLIKSFAEVDNNFQHIFAHLSRLLPQYVYALNDQVVAKHHLKPGMTYRKAVTIIEKLLTQENDKIKIQTKQWQLKHNILYQQSQVFKNRSQRQIQYLKSQVQFYKKQANTEYVLSLEQKIQTLKQTLSTQLDDYKSLARLNQETTLELDNNKKLIDHLHLQSSILQDKIHDLNINKENHELYLLAVKDRFDELMVRMIGVKEIIQKVEEENQRLVSQRKKFAHRASTGFEELTPRPKYAKIFDFSEAGSNLNSTEEIFEQIMDKLTGEKQAILKNIILTKNNRKLMEAELIRQKLVHDIKISKESIPK